MSFSNIDEFIKSFLNVKNYNISLPFSDASTRKYFRIYVENKTFILVYYPVEDKSTFNNFINISNFLNNKFSFTVPYIYKSDYSLGLMLIEDLGEDSFFNYLNKNKQLIKFLYRQSCKVLYSIHQYGIDKLFLPHYKHSFFLNLLTNNLKYYFYYNNIFYKDYYIQKITNYFYHVLNSLQVNNDSIIMRDYHSPNLMYLKNARGMKKIGVIDFQDAGIYNRFYDIASVVYDARIYLNENQSNNIFDSYYSQIESEKIYSYENSWEICNIFALMRNFTILGIFCKYYINNNNKKYLPFISNIEKYIKRVLTYSNSYKPLRSIIDNIGLYNLVK